MDFSVRSLTEKLIGDYEIYYKLEKKIPFGSKFLRRAGSENSRLVSCFPELMQKAMKLDYRPRRFTFYSAVEAIWEKKMVRRNQKDLFLVALMELRKTWRIWAPLREEDRMMYERSVRDFDNWLDMEKKKQVLDENIEKNRECVDIDRVVKMGSVKYRVKGSFQIDLIISIL